MGFLSKIFKPIGKIVGGFLGGGGGGAKESDAAAEESRRFAAEARAQRAENERKTAKEKKRASKLAVRGLRSKRSASYFQNQPADQAQGSATIG